MKLLWSALLISSMMAVPLTYAETTASDTLSDAAGVYDWKDKLGRGALNIVTSPVEIGRSIHIGTQDKSLAYGWTVGLIKGIGQGIVRLGAGVVEVLTFPFDFPGGGKDPLINPEYVWQKSGVKYT